MTDAVETSELDDSIFGDDVDIDDIPDNPNHLPEDIYVCRISKAVMKPTNAGDKVGLTLTYQIIEGPYSSSFPFTEWLWIPKVEKGVELTVEEIRANSRLKNHFISAGFGADEIRGKKPRDLIGKVLKVKTRNKMDKDKNERINISNVMAAEDGHVSGSDEGLDVFSKSADDI